MISPYVRRLHLAAEIRKLRLAKGWTTASELAERLRVKRERISKIETGYHVDMALLQRILEEADADGYQRELLTDLARQGAEAGWWQQNAKAMGPRQAVVAELEAGAATICEYQLTMLPGLLQLPAYTQARIDAERQLYRYTLDPEQVLYARRKRQTMLTRPGGPSYEVVLDELAIRRPLAPADILRTQLDHLIFLGHEQPRINIRVLPIHASVADFVVPRSAFSIYTYPDPDDPVVVIVDTVTKDLLHTDQFSVQRYQMLYHRLAAAALSPSDSLDFLISVSNQLNEGASHVLHR